MVLWSLICSTIDFLLITFLSIKMRKKHKQLTCSISWFFCEIMSKWNENSSIPSSRQMIIDDLRFTTMKFKLLLRLWVKHEEPSKQQPWESTHNFAFAWCWTRGWLELELCWVFLFFKRFVWRRRKENSARGEDFWAADFWGKQIIVNIQWIITCWQLSFVEYDSHEPLTRLTGSNLTEGSFPFYSCNLRNTPREYVWQLFFSLPMTTFMRKQNPRFVEGQSRLWFAA